MGIAGFTGEFSDDEVFSFTILLKGNALWDWPENAYFEKYQSVFTCGDDLINITTDDGGVTWYATVAARGYGTEECQSAYGVGSCCYTDNDNELNCKDLISETECGELNESIWNPLSTCDDNCGKYIGVCCSEGGDWGGFTDKAICLNSTGADECNYFNGSFWDTFLFRESNPESQDYSPLSLDYNLPITCGGMLPCSLIYPNSPDCKEGEGNLLGTDIPNNICIDPCEETIYSCCKGGICIGDSAGGGLSGLPPISPVVCRYVYGGVPVASLPETPLEDRGCGSVDCCDYTTYRGACCNYDGECEDNVDKNACISSGRVFIGPNTICDEVNCCLETTPAPAITQACCFDDNVCLNLEQSECILSAGIPWGIDTNCSDANVCGEDEDKPLKGSCCYSAYDEDWGIVYDCLDGMLDSECETLSGDFNTLKNCGERISDGECQDGYETPYSCCYGNSECYDNADPNQCQQLSGIESVLTCAQRTNCNVPSELGSCCYDLANNYCSQIGPYCQDGVSTSWCAAIQGEFNINSTCLGRVDEEACSLNMPTFQCAACCRCVDGIFECDNIPKYVCQLLKGVHYEDGIYCDQINCGGKCLPSQQYGRCCEADDICTETIYDDCLGEWTIGLGCAEGACVDPPVYGACCYTDGTPCANTTDIACSGLWNKGQACSSIDCQRYGACCSAGNCTYTTPDLCEGKYQGDWIDCVSANCQPPESSGACCVLDKCTVDTEQACLDSGGTYEGDNTDCSVNPCPEYAACCLSDNTCTENYNEKECISGGGVFHSGEACADTGGNITCEPEWACCDTIGNCTEVIESACTGVFNPNVLCADITCEVSPGGGCCACGQCSRVALSSYCSGTYLGDGIECDVNLCPPYDPDIPAYGDCGVCCVGNNDCLDDPSFPEADCVLFGADWDTGSQTCCYGGEPEGECIGNGVCCLNGVCDDGTESGSPDNICKCKWLDGTWHEGVSSCTDFDCSNQLQFAPKNANIPENDSEKINNKFVRLPDGECVWVHCGINMSCNDYPSCNDDLGLSGDDDDIGISQGGCRRCQRRPIKWKCCEDCPCPAPCACFETTGEDGEPLPEEKCGSAVETKFEIKEVQGIGNTWLGKLEFSKLSIQAFVNIDNIGVAEETCRLCTMPAMNWRAYFYAPSENKVWESGFTIGGSDVLDSDIGTEINLGPKNPNGVDAMSILGYGCDGQCHPHKFDYTVTLAFFREDNMHILGGDCPKVHDYSFANWVDSYPVSGTCYPVWFAKDPTKPYPIYEWPETEDNVVKNIAMDPNMCGDSRCPVVFPSRATRTPPYVGRYLRGAGLVTTFGFNMWGRGACPC
tara:strand:- start:90 stop:4064 length:3975 start_codon:yes stop_codon:yes gene_type:complete